MSVNVGEEIKKYEDEILEDIISIVGIESVKGEPAPGMPFGEGPAKALRYSLDLAKSFGLRVKNVDNRAGHVEYGEGEGLIGVLAHVDVVPAGEGWSVPRFGDTVKDGRVYGRGTMDDKGPAIAAIYCLKALKDLGIKTKRRIRVILGASEESGMEDMEYYFAHEEMPDMAFTPDSEYPICCMEKGILQLSVSGRDDGSRIQSFHSGSAANMVPASAKAVIACTESEAAGLTQKAQLKQESGASFTVRCMGAGKASVECAGSAAHASTPELGVNAAAYLLEFLNDYCGRGLTGFLRSAIGTGLDGGLSGVACSDESGALTLNLGVVDIAAPETSAVIDIRYPVNKDGEEICQRLSALAGKCGLKTGVIKLEKPLSVGRDSELVKKLQIAYKTVMHSEAGLYATGGGSYARALHNRGVAFGAGIKPLSHHHIHSADEFLEVSDFMKHCEICLQAVYELACK